MHRLAVGAFAGFALAGCLGETIHRCMNGAICAADEACTEVVAPTEQSTLCGLPRLVEQCYGAGKQDFERCNYTADIAEPDGTCVENLCRECQSVEISGCVVAGWNPMSSPVTTDLLGVSVLDAATAVAVGTSGTVIRYNGKAWTRVDVPMSAMNAVISDVWVADRSTFFVVTQGGQVLGNRDGVWSEESSTGVLLTSIDGIDASRGVAVGFNGSVLHYNGATWSPLQVTPMVPLYGVGIIDDETTYAVGHQGSIFRHSKASNAWTNVVMPVTGQKALKAVAGRTANDVFAAGDHLTAPDNPNMLHYTGSGWDPVPLQSMFGIQGPITISSIYVAPGGKAFAAGRLGNLLYFDGSAWSTTIEAGSPQFFGIDGTDFDNVIAVGQGGVIRRYTGKPR